jgi:prepilin-type N-terminal cleavage/methylation domain
VSDMGFLKTYRHKHIGNKGFSLVELIVIIAIVAVSAGATTISMSSLYSFHVKQCAYDIDALLSKCKVGVMSKEGNVYLRLYNGTDGIYCEYYEAGIAVANEKIAKDTVSISYISSNGDTINTIGTGGLYISFDRTTGSLLTLGEAATLGGATVGDEGYYSTAIIVESGEKNVTVRIVPTTGKHFIES